MSSFVEKKILKKVCLISNTVRYCFHKIFSYAIRKNFSINCLELSERRYSDNFWFRVKREASLSKIIASDVIIEIFLKWILRLAHCLELGVKLHFVILMDNPSFPYFSGRAERNFWDFWCFYYDRTEGP